MYGIPEDHWKVWKKKRRNTLIAFLIFGTIEGIDSSLISSTLYFYLRQTVYDGSQRMTYYSFIIAGFYVSASISGLICGRWLDKSRKVRLYANLTLLVRMVGVLLYSMPYHPAFLLVGRCICGISDPFVPVITGEVIRMYGNRESAGVLFAVSSSFALGFTIGPLLNLLIKDIRFQIGSLKVNHFNFVGLFLFVLLCGVVLVVNFLIHDCSREIDVKEKIEEEVSARDIAENNQVGKKSKKEDSSTTPLNKPHEDLPVHVIIINLLSNFDCVLLLVSTFVFVFIVHSGTSLFPVIAVDLLHWKVSTLSVAWTFDGIFNFVLLVLMTRFCTSDRSVYWTTILSMVSQMVMCISLLCLKYVHGNAGFEVAMSSIFIISMTLGWLFDTSLVRLIFAKMIVSRQQCFSECIRTSLSKLALIIGAAAVPLAIKWMVWWAVVMIVIAVLFVCVFVQRRSSLSCPKEVCFAPAVQMNTNEKGK